MTDKNMFKISEVAAQAGVSVRTLHHYDAIGLLDPAGRSAKGYRLYDHAGLLRLQQIVIRRALGFPLEQIRQTLDEPGFDLRAALSDQRERLGERLGETEAMIRAVDEALAQLEAASARRVEIAALFDGFDPADHEHEVEERWGQTEAYAESTRRTRDYGPEQWQEIKSESARINTELAALLTAGVAPDDPRTMDLAERHRAHISRWFYPCPATMHVGLGQMYEGDARFTATYDRVTPGLAVFLAAAITANAARVQAEA